MRILLLGATGPIGSAAAARLAGDGHELVGLARAVDPAARRLPVALASIALYLLTGACWLPVVWMQTKIRDLASEAAAVGGPLPERCQRLYRSWFAFGFPAFAAVLAIFWLMIARPEIAP